MEDHIILVVNMFQENSISNSNFGEDKKSYLLKNFVICSLFFTIAHESDRTINRKKKF